jgi:hypothetical protein
MDTGHWIYPLEFDPDEWFGFIYRIVDNKTGKHYIGKKQFRSTKRKIVKNKKNRKVVRSDSKWRSYTSSSEHINDAILVNGKEQFSFYIESLHKTKASLHYAEVEAQIFEDVFRTTLENGDRKYYNKMVGNMRFIVPNLTPDELQHKNMANRSLYWSRFVANLTEDEKQILIAELGKHLK